MRRPKQYNEMSSLVIVALIGLLRIRVTYGLLLYPTSSTLQLTTSMSVPVELPNKRKCFMDLGFQMNYNLPFSPASFYNVAIWADTLSRRQKRQLGNELELRNGVHPMDITAGELYAGLERALHDYGFHRSCLLLSVCELALHPFDDDQNIFIQIITFLLTPSQHEGFGVEEKLYRDRYERAEQIGFLGGDCQRSFPKCEVDILNIVTRLVR